MYKFVSVFLISMILAFVVSGNNLGYAGEKEKSVEHFFINCNNALKLKDFSGLKGFFNRHPKWSRPDECFRLNDSEFLVTVNDTGRIAQGLYFVDVKQDKMKMDGGYSLVHVAEEFTGKNKKRYVLLRFGGLSGGVMYDGYDILNLIPTTNGKSYTRYSLLEVSEDGVDGFCGERREKFREEGINAESIESYRILNEGTQDVTLIFNIKSEDCKTLSKKQYAKKFRLIDDVFKLIK
jgi:hypothetical protein